MSAAEYERRKAELEYPDHTTYAQICGLIAMVIFVFVAGVAMVLSR